MKTLPLKKVLLIALAAVAVVAAVVVFVLSQQGYRSVRVYRLDGEAELTRSNRTMVPAEGTMLRSGDHLKTAVESWLYLQIDDDKYMLAEPETSFSIIAKGTSERSRTKIELEFGALVSHLTNPLSDDSSYEVETPNSVMAVRGTSFRVSVWYDSEGVSHTKLEVFEGIVEVHLRYPDGSLSEEGRFFGPGSVVTIWGNSATSDYDEAGEWTETISADGIVILTVTANRIDYYSLEIPTLEFLKIGLLELTDGYDITLIDLNEVIRNKQSVFTVTFTVNSRQFAVQYVKWGECAHAPLLSPSAGSSWDFDFTTPIYADTEIRWGK